MKLMKLLRTPVENTLRSLDRHWSPSSTAWSKRLSDLCLGTERLVVIWCCMIFLRTWLVLWIGTQKTFVESEEFGPITEWREACPPSRENDQLPTNDSFTPLFSPPINIEQKRGSAKLAWSVRQYDTLYCIARITTKLTLSTHSPVSGNT